MKMIQIRNVPEDVHRILKVRAAERGLSLSDYVLQEIERFARRPTMEEVLTRIKSAGSVHPSIDSATLIREIRDGQ